MESVTAPEAITTRPVRVAVVQLDLPAGDVERNRARTAAAVREAGERGAQLVVLPELASSGYGLGTVEAVAAVAEEIPGPTTEAWREAAAESGTAVVGGICERAGDVHYNSVAVVTPEGVVGRYRKLHLFDLEQVFYAPGDEGLPVIDLPFGRVGVAVCYDLRFVESLRILTLQGAEIVAVPTAWTTGFDPRLPEDGIIDQVRAAAVQANLNGVWVAAASRTGSDGDIHYLGSSCVVNPYGRFAVAPRPVDAESIEVVEVDLADAARAKVRGPRIRPLADRRTDVYDELLGYH